MHSTLQREIPATTTRYSFCAVGTYIHPIPGKLRGFSAQLQLVARYIELSNIHRDFCCLSKLYIPLSICKSRYFIQNKSMTISVLCLAIYAIYQTRCVSTPIKDKLDHYPPTSILLSRTTFIRRRRWCNGQSRCLLFRRRDGYLALVVVGTGTLASSSSFSTRDHEN